MEFLIAIVGVALALWMLYSARGRHRKPPERREGDQD
jgi:hypothetical protein